MIFRTRSVTLSATTQNVSFPERGEKKQQRKNYSKICLLWFFHHFTDTPWQHLPPKVLSLKAILMFLQEDVQSVLSLRSRCLNHLNLHSFRSIQPIAPGVNKSSSSFELGYGGNVASVGWQVKLRDAKWHAGSHSGDVLRTNCHIYALKQNLTWKPNGHKQGKPDDSETMALHCEANKCTLFVCEITSSNWAVFGWLVTRSNETVSIKSVVMC